MAKIICSECKSIKDVDEKPESVTSFVCSECQLDKPEESSTKSSPPKKKKKKKRIPRKDHGTRVMLPITCSECGKTETLDYVPKGADLNDILCSECAREEFGTDSDWARIDRTKQEEAGDREWEFECDTCGQTDYLPFEPKEDRTYECNLCRMDHETPSPERLKGRELAAGGVFIRRNDDPEDTDED